MVKSQEDTNTTNIQQQQNTDVSLIVLNTENNQTFELSCENYSIITATMMSCDPVRQAPTVPGNRGGADCRWRSSTQLDWSDRFQQVCKHCKQQHEIFHCSNK